MSKYTSVYQKFLNLANAIEDLAKFPQLTPDEKCLLRHLNNYWINDKDITVVHENNLNVYDMLRCGQVILTSGFFEQLRERLGL